jgi:hypothetical protein
MKKIITISLAFLAITLAGCLDDDKYALDPSGSNNIIEFLDPAPPSSQVGAIYPVWLSTFAVSPEATITQRIKYSGPQSNDKDIVLQLAVDPAALEQYNTQMTVGINGADPLGGATFEVLPEANYDIPELTLTIPKGEREVEFSVTIYPDQFDLSKSYALPLRIVSASSGVLSQHYSVAILAPVVKNKYDGIYTVTPPVGEVGLIHTNPAFTGLYPKTIELRTVNGNTNVYYDRGEDFAFHLFMNGTTLTYFGNFRIQFVMDTETDQVVNATNSLGQGTGNRHGKLNPAQPSTPQFTFEDDGVTPISVEIWYIMAQPDIATTVAQFKEVYTYVGPRD